MMGLRCGRLNDQPPNQRAPQGKIVGNQPAAMDG